MNTVHYDAIRGHQVSSSFILYKKEKGYYEKGTINM